jgi:UDP-3-O-[3-hydroxymyristoyl] glucosamine N-acyltransferase
MTVPASALLREMKPRGILLDMAGPDTALARIAPADACAPGDLVFVDDAKYVDAVLARRPAAAVTRPELAAKLAAITVLTSPNVRLAHAWIGQRFFDRDLRGDEWPRIHPSAVVHETAQVPSSVHVGPNAVIGRRARLGERCVVMAGAVIEHEAVLGEGAVVHPNAVIGWGCEIGRDCVIKSGAVIGSEGFGFAQDERKRNHRIPQMGRVVISDRVIVGAACCIDRATCGETRIGPGTVMDNLCHVAHNVVTGEDCILTAMLCVAGSSTLGNRVITSGMTGILDHVTVCDDAVLVQRAGVANDIKEPGTYAGGPTQPIKDYMRNQAVYRKLADLRDTVRALERKVAALEGR